MTAHYPGRATIEGYGDDPVMAALRRAFHEHHALQCGFCTPGILMSTSDWLNRIRDRVPHEQEVRNMLSGHLCRCTGYAPIVAAVMEVAQIRYDRRSQGTSSEQIDKESSHA